MDYGISQILEIIGALCFFIFGMKMMSDGIQRAAGSQLRTILRNMTKNRFLGVFTGFLTTAFLQSSSATTVMTVSFVNAGLLTLVESAGVMMGANIGTTITGWIISLLGFKIKLSAYSIPLFGIGVPLWFSQRGKSKFWGEFIIGFAILFLGLSYLKDAVPDLRNNPEIFNWLKGFTEWGILSRLFFVLIGALVTLIVQSSSAAMAITLTMCAQGWLPFDVAAAMILGENIGTTITAELASLVGNVSAKRSARIHSMFNIIGVGWMVVLMPLFLPVLSNIASGIFGIGDPFTDPEAMPLGLSAFHTAFNLLNVILLLGFVPYLVKVAIWSVKGKEESEDEFRLKYINNAQRTPELATVELQKEMAHFGEIATNMPVLSRSLINSTDKKERKKLTKKLKKYEQITDDMESEITDYISKLSRQEITTRTSERLRSMVNISNDIERIGDVFYEIAMTIKNKNNQNIYFTPKQREGLNQMMNHIDDAFSIMNENLNNSNYSKVTLASALAKEVEINTLRDKLRKKNLSKLDNEGYNVKSAMIYYNVFTLLEKVGDHIMNVTEAIAGEI